MNPQGAMTFLIDVAINLFIFLLLTRFILQLVRADFYNPVSQFVVKATNPVLTPLRRMVPGSSTVDVASLVMVVVLIILKTVLVVVLNGQGVPPVPALVIYALRSLASLMINYLFFAVLIRVILSWVAPDPYNPFTAIMTQITEPVMAPVRRILPPMGGLDLSPLVVLLGLQFLMILFAI
ncbi:YggT family protein [Isoalcanivorax indicus]|uniref:YggT family protein n=1 Tax=Isoalcanivorax indicus TaxID=2202653 RepID=UPI000DB976B5|nr:YggT family protein [Isoalcanivorax indicus]